MSGMSVPQSNNFTGPERTAIIQVSVYNGKTSAHVSDSCGHGMYEVSQQESRERDTMFLVRITHTGQQWPISTGAPHMPRQPGGRDIPVTVRFKEWEKKEVEEVSRISGIPQSKIIADGAMSRCAELRGMFLKSEQK